MQQKPDDAVFRSHEHKKLRTFAFPTREERLRGLMRRVFPFVCALGLVYSSTQLVGYVAQHVSSAIGSRELREIYYEVATDTPTAPPTPTLAPVISPEPRSLTAYTAAPTVSAGPTPPLWLEKRKYPGNPNLLISSRVAKLRRQNEDIIGWLRIEDLVDEAVVQRDNSYYLRRDYRGYHNSNGAVFLEETCDLTTRPYTLMLFAHNMKTGAMFGALRNYEDIGFYRRSPFVSFESLYEEGRYVIFSVATLSMDARDYNYFDFSKLNTRNVARRKDMIRLLKIRSLYQTELDIEPSDQLLLLITCVGDSDERRVIAARRIREGETEENLRRIVQRSRTR